MKKIELFSARICPFAHRTRLALMEINLPFTLVDIDLRDKPEWFLKINPTGSVPALRQGDFLLHESLVINEYVNECCAESPLLPGTVQKRAEARQWISYSNSNFVPAFYRVLKAQDEEKQDKSWTELNRVLETLNHILQQGDGPYWNGRQAGLTDIAFYPWFERWPLLEHYQGKRIPEQLSFLLRWIERMQEREAVKLGGEPVEYYIEQYATYAAGKK